MWSQGSSGVFKSCSLNLFSYAVQVMFLLFPSSGLKQCSSNLLFNLVPVDIGHMVMWCYVCFCLRSCDAQNNHFSIWCLMVYDTCCLHPVLSHILLWACVFHPRGSLHLSRVFVHVSHGLPWAPHFSLGENPERHAHSTLFTLSSLPCELSLRTLACSFSLID